MPPDTEPPTHLLHRLTSYSHDREWTEPVPDPRIVQGLVPNDEMHRPQWYKAYDADLPRILLTPDLPASTVPALAVLAGTAEPGEHAPHPSFPPDLAGLARLLHLSAGITRTTVNRAGVTMLFRAAGSAGARFPLELYVAVPGDLDTDVPPGVHWYDPDAHALVTVGPPPAGTAPTVVVTGVPWRTGWRYAERGFRHIYWDAGTMLAQLVALADSAGLPARLHTAFPDAEVAALVGADPVTEFPVAVVALGPGDPALRPTGDAVPGRHDADGVVFPLVTQAQRAGCRSALGPELDRGPVVALETTPEPVTPIDAVVAGKGSIRRLRADRSVPLALLRDAMAVSTRGIDVPHWIGANAVENLAPGVYRWPDLEPARRSRSEAALREELHGAALEQGLAHDASFVVMSGIELAGVDDHRYREVQLLAGLVEGRLHLAAGALGVAASGMTFRDADLPGLLGPDVAGLLWTCVGVPEYRTRPSGRPGQPAEVHIVWPR
ncbi:MAG: SagB/ThcOx family dehydrogenase [Intrasporangium sp.]|uniref:SagB/ThcOx family dehydrogenase n=1 Tax=Intrasporangium sp. TaxID=1925024 RepID=UPI0026478DF0|nr:SagB/ThcOx family dehydrogenase [Intrasporangium sp.]MDN5794718.1 SagB/ThcOx family dehydrogenase [Intrasporangium sp.]